MSITEAIVIHTLTLGSLLTYEYAKLRQHILFHWFSVGFWVWGAILFYCVAVPLYHWFLGDPYYIETRLAVTEGIPRLLWITLCIAIGSFAFFFAYYRSKPTHFHFNLPLVGWPKGTFIILTLSLLGAAYCLVKFRGFMGLPQQQGIQIVGSKFVGNTIGYEYVMHTFALFPISLLIFHKPTRYLGYGLALLYILGRLEDKGDRMSIVSLLICVSMIEVILRRRRWPSRYLIIGIILFTAILEARGHTSLSEYISSGGLSVGKITTEVEHSPSATMIHTLWLESYLSDKCGYTYGLPLLNDLLFGALPRKYFPWKSDVMEKLIPHRPKDFNVIYGSERMAGAKSMVFGSLYGYGGMVGIILGMLILGLLARKLDGFISSESMILRTLGIVWLSMIWMIFGSSLAWGMQSLLLSGLPALGIILLNKFQSKNVPIFLKRNSVAN
ncbi:MAG: hypothetical protein PHX53_03670 [Syntrophales bacterium]|nr:hypothetical protein [Syntrophales bacterium]